MKIAALIPARGGSKRLPGKNIMPFCGQPLIRWSINFALRSGFEGVYVSTDDKAIAEESERSGAKVIQRPEHLSTDFSPTADAAKHAFEIINSKNNIDWLCTLQPTNPLRPRDLFERLTKKMQTVPADSSVMTVTRSHYKIGRTTEDGLFTPAGYQPGQRSQDMDKFYYENGLAYMTPASLMTKGQLFGDRVYTIETAKFCDLDIDDMLDFRFGEMLFKENESEFRYLL
jgi:N-acylneuraminate cytidylyltransferase